MFYYVLFGLMLSDAAYGLIMIIGCTYCLKKIKNLEPGFRKMLKMFLYCGISTTFWGFMFGSFFGDAVNVIATTFFGRPDIRLAPIWFEPVSLPMKMLVFAFALGILHLFTGLGIKLYSCVKGGSVTDALYDAGFWYMLVGGAILYLLTMPMFTDMLGLSFVVPAAVGNVCAVLAVDVYKRPLYGGVPDLGHHRGSAVLYELQARGEEDGSPVPPCGEDAGAVPQDHAQAAAPQRAGHARFRGPSGPVHCAGP